MASNKEEPEDAGEVGKDFTDFDPFLDDLASVLTSTTVKKLAQVFEYSAEEVVEYGNARNPSEIFAKSLREKNIISPNSISQLKHAFKEIQLDGLSVDVERFFKKNRKMAEFEDRKKTFIDALKRTYEDHFDHTQPIPFINDRQLLVNEVFRDNCIEVFKIEGLKKSWKKLSSRHRIFEDSRKDSKRFILKGEPGYGKFTLAQQFAYDWRTRCEQSPLRDVEIFVLLQLSCVNYKHSIFSSIKKLLLLNEPKVEEADIEKVLSSSDSVVIVLHDFEKYARKAGNGDGDAVTKIIGGQMFPNFRVILTTTPSCEPENMPPSVIRMRLNGFDEETQDRYFWEVLGEPFKEIKEEIDDNRVIRKLCKIPFVLGLVLNLVAEDKKPFSYETITGFVRYMIFSYYEKRKTKLRPADQRKYGELKENYGKLNKLSFEALMEKSQNKKWRTDELRKAIGGEVYDQFITMGIFVEEESIVINESLSGSTSGLVQLKRHTRFYHSIFHEWYAAHYLSGYAARFFTFGFDETLKKLRENKIHYVFQFACGINPEVASKIIKFLHHRKDRQLEILCVREQKEYGKK